jgi:hypothetical protein
MYRHHDESSEEETKEREETAQPRAAPADDAADIDAYGIPTKSIFTSWLSLSPSVIFGSRSKRKWQNRLIATPPFAIAICQICSIRQTHRQIWQGG